MFKYVDKNTLVIVDSPVRFDLRMKEFKHLKVYIPNGESQPKEAKKGFTMKDIGKVWGISYKTIQRNRQKWLPFPDGRWKTSLVWNKIPSKPNNKSQILEI